MGREYRKRIGQGCTKDILLCTKAVQTSICFRAWGEKRIECLKTGVFAVLCSLPT